MTEFTIIYNTAQLVQIQSNTINDIENGAVIIQEGKITEIGKTEAITREFPPENASTAIDAADKTVLPGLVDPHTHTAFAGDRYDEFTAKLHGKTYQEISDEGGGILRTVRAVRTASREELIENILQYLDGMLAHGTTTVEIKSGYGLSVEAEMKLLQAIKEADNRHPIDIIPTFLGAHSVPEGISSDDYVNDVIDNQLPAIGKMDIVEFCDVFCEPGVFSVDESRRVLSAGKDYGLTPKIHAEEFERQGGAQLAAEVNAASADHLLQATQADAQALAEADVTPVLLPGTAFTLDIEYANPSLFTAQGQEVAIATDFNPNCHSYSMEFTIDLACNAMRMDPGEAIRAATVTAARSLDRTDGTGTLQEESSADIIIADVPTFEHIPYTFGISTVETVLKNGQVVYDDR
ncbi:MAG: imidazolonepropionase [Halobacteriaceae archaeon]